MTDEDKVVGRWKIFAEQAEFAERFGGHEVSVIDDGDEHFAGAMDFEGFLNEEFFAVMIMAVKLDVESVTQDTQGVVIGVKGAVDDGSDDALGVVCEEGMFEDAFAGAGFTQKEAKAALLSVDFEDVKDLLLMGKEADGFDVEGVALNAEVRADHKFK